MMVPFDEGPNGWFPDDLLDARPVRASLRLLVRGPSLAGQGLVLALRSMGYALVTMTVLLVGFQLWAQGLPLHFNVGPFNVKNSSTLVHCAQHQAGTCPRYLEYFRGRPDQPDNQQEPGQPDPPQEPDLLFRVEGGGGRKRRLRK